MSCQKKINLISEASKGEGLHCIDSNRGLVLGIVNEEALSSFNNKLTTIKTSIAKLRDATKSEMRKVLDKKAPGKLLQKERRNIDGGCQKCTRIYKIAGRSSKKEKEKQLGLDKSAYQRKVLKKLIQITDEAMVKLLKVLRVEESKGQIKSWSKWVQKMKN